MPSSNSDPDDRPMPTLIRRIVFGYTLDNFPGAIVLGHHQLKRMVARAGFAIKVTLAPLTDLPPDTDLLFIPPELESVAHSLLAPERIHIVEEMVNHPSYARLIENLVEGVAITAARRDDPTAAENAGNIITYRGNQRVE